MELWNGYSCETLEFEGREAIIVSPQPSMAIGRLAVKTEYWDAFPQAVELPLLAKGFHLCYVKNDSRWGLEGDLERKARFIQTVTARYGLNPRVVLVGMSCGGLMAVKLAAMYPDLVSCLYLDAPVINYLSCPCGFGLAAYEGKAILLPEMQAALGLHSLTDVLQYRRSPLDLLPELVRCRIPVVMVAGEQDQTVPYAENGRILQDVYEEAGLDLQVRLKPDCDHHPHGLEDPTDVVAFILQHT